MNDAMQTNSDTNFEAPDMQHADKRDPIPARSVVHPTRSLFKPNDGFVWVPPVATDIRKTFARVRAQGVAA